jgi:glycosyltransferase involved in cell wall biosynthesis
MRVIHVVASTQRRGAEIFAADLVGALGSVGVVQRVVALRGSGGLAVEFGVPTTVLSANGPMLPGLKMGLPGLRELRRSIHEWHPDVVQAHGGEALKYALLGAGRAGRTVVYRRIGSAPQELSRGLRRAVYARLMRRAGSVVAVAEAVRAQTLEIFRLSRHHVVTIPNAVDARRLEPDQDRAQVRHALGIPADAMVLLSLGALVWEKDPLTHLEVSAKVLAERPDAWHLVVGDGPMRHQAEAAARRHGLHERVRFAGARSDAADLLAASDVLLFASCSEGMPATVIEAGMLGVPVTGFAVAGVSEVVEHGVTGLLAQPGDVDGLCLQILELLGDEERRQAMAARARERCRTSFDITVVAPRYVDLYRAMKVTG